MRTEKISQNVSQKQAAQLYRLFCSSVLPFPVLSRYETVSAAKNIPNHHGDNGAREEGIPELHAKNKAFQSEPGDSINLPQCR